MCAGVALGYSQLTDADIINLPVPKLQANGFLFVWVINAKYKFTLDLFDRWGYKCVPFTVMGFVHLSAHPAPNEPPACNSKAAPEAGPRESSIILICRLVDEVVWVKMTVNRRMAKSHGYYLQHAKEVQPPSRKKEWARVSPAQYNNNNKYKYKYYILL